MPSSDISKCSGDNCPIKETCLRFTVPAKLIGQSNISPLYDPERGRCHNYLEGRH